MYTVNQDAFDAAIWQSAMIARSQGPEDRANSPISLRILRARQDERKQIARELHDTTAQLLLELDFALGSTQDNPLLGTPIDARDVVARLQNQLRCLAYILHPPELERFGLAGALEALSLGMSARTGIPISFRTNAHHEGLPPEMELAMLRIGQEALMNMFKHSGTDRAEMRLYCTCNWLCLRVRDFGIGCQAREAIEAGQGVGMRAMTERMAEIGGFIRINLFEQGTSVSAIVRKPFGGCPAERAAARLRGGSDTGAMPL